VLRAFNQFFVVAESGCRYVEGTFDDLLADLTREREDGERRYLGELNRLVAKEEHNATVRRRRRRKKNVGRIRELKRCPARIKLNDKRSYKQESQGKRAVLQKMRIDAARDGARSSRRTLPVVLPLELALPRLPEGPAAPVITCEAVAASSGERPLFSGVSLDLRRDRLAVCGPNGSGKTTLLEIAMGLRRPVAGRARCDTSRVGYIAQNAGNWCLDESLAEHVAAELPPTSPATVIEILHAHRFPLALADRPLATLSPGERVRAALICLTRREPVPELLVLDEPTQHLDFVGLAALEAVLAAWPGGLLVVSHDAEFLDAIGVSRRFDL
jgi:ATPase subunit of ABC transporter with duplicated ATPase domains